MIMSLLAFTIIVVILGEVTSQNHDVNFQTPYRGMTGKRSVEATTPFSPDSQIDNKGFQLPEANLKTLCVEKLEFLITDTNRRLESLENQLSRGYSCPACPVILNIENLEAKMENVDKNLQNLMDATRSLPSDVEASSLITVTRSLVDLSSSPELKQIFNEGLQEEKDLQIGASSSCPLNFTLNKL